jgi:DNA-binding transcriptional MerR regulator
VAPVSSGLTLATGAAIYSIGALSRMLGVPPATLRAWEERYGVVVPERSGGAQRLYSRDHVEQLRFVCEQIEVGLSAADAHRELAEHLASGAAFAADPGEVPEHHIVLVERDPYAAELAEYFLRTEGYGVAIARDAESAAGLVRGLAPAVALVDLMIDGGVGLELCAQLHELVSVLAVSTLDQREAAGRAGVDAFLRKPLDPLVLVSTVRDLMATSALTRRRNAIRMS